MPDLDEDAIEAAALEPQSASSDGQSVTQRSIPDMIAAAKYAAAKRAAASTALVPGVRWAKLKMPGGTGE